MRHAYRFAPRLALALALAGLTLVGWVARSTQAQDGAKPRADAEKPADLPLPSPPSQESTPGTPLGLTEPQAAPLPPVLDNKEAAASTPVPANDDPEQNARAFVERNRKEAQDELKNLRDEEKRLRARLGKVEAGIRRWEALLTALDSSERIAPPVALRPIPSDSPTQLDPIAAGKPATDVVASVPLSPKQPASVTVPSVPEAGGPKIDGKPR